MTAELIAGLRGRDQASYRQLITEYGPALYRIALRLTDGPHDAQDVLQETLLTVMAKVDTVHDPAMLGAWLRTVTVNNALMRRRRSREEPVGELGAGDGFTADGNRVQPVSSWPPLPEAELLRRETRGVLEAAVRELPVGAREVYVLADIEDLPREEVAALLDISRDAVRVRLHRARTTLRQALEDYFAERRMLTSRRPEREISSRGTEDTTT
jgi:RNA polymerase sigma-70 factor (ECF subfamily)